MKTNKSSTLLKALKKRQAKYRSEARKLQTGCSGPYLANRLSYEKWIYDNITSRGLRCIFSNVTGEPEAIIKVLAGKLNGEIASCSVF